MKMLIILLNRYNFLAMMTRNINIILKAQINLIKKNILIWINRFIILVIKIKLEKSIKIQKVQIKLHRIVKYKIIRKLKIYQT